MPKLDYLTIFVSAAVALLLLWCWELVFHKGKKEKWVKVVFKELLRFFALYLASLVMMTIEIYLQVASFWDGVFTGFMIFIGFLLPLFIYYGSRAASLKELFLDAGLWFFILLVIGGVVAG